jgi:predicted SAM-dependent methyltransferase
MGNNEAIKLNIGCGGRPLSGYVNIDSDDLDTLRRRYPDTVFPDGITIYDYNIFALPFADGTVDEIRADSLIEHLSFTEEPLFFREVKRVLKPGGVFSFSTTNFEKIVEMWLKARDEWKEFFRNDDKAIRQKHWFGQYSYSTDNRWGYLSAMIFGSQNGQGQFHKNCYTVPKIRAMLSSLDFEITGLTESLWKGERDPMINVVAKKSR